MGSFNGTCGLTGASVLSGDDVVAMVLRYGTQTNAAMAPVSYPMYGLTLLTLPFAAHYDDYGRVIPYAAPGYADPSIAAAPCWNRDGNLRLSPVLRAVHKQRDEDRPPFIWMAHRAAFEHLMDANCYHDDLERGLLLQPVEQGGREIATAVAGILRGPDANDVMKRVRAISDFSDDESFVMSNGMQVQARFSQVLRNPARMLDFIAGNSDYADLGAQELTTLLESASLPMAKLVHFERVVDALRIRITPPSAAGSQMDNAKLRLSFHSAMGEVTKGIVAKRDADCEWDAEAGGEEPSASAFRP